jgi:HEAT repeat protein
MAARTVPRGFLGEVMSNKGYRDLVEDLAVSHRSRAALWRLVAEHDAADADIRSGLGHANAVVRARCCEVIDQAGIAEAVPELSRLLEDSDPTVRFWAGHAVACERCRRRGQRLRASP